MVRDGDAARSASSPSPFEGPEVSGSRVVLTLFGILAACVVFVFTVFALAVRPEDRHWLPELTFRYLYMPVVATSLLVAVDAYRVGWHAPRGWWLFFFTAPVPLLNILLASVWLLRWRPQAIRR